MLQEPDCATTESIVRLLCEKLINLRCQGALGLQRCNPPAIGAGDPVETFCGDSATRAGAIRRMTRLGVVKKLLLRKGIPPGLICPSCCCLALEIFRAQCVSNTARTPGRDSQVESLAARPEVVQKLYGLPAARIVASGSALTATAAPMAH